MRLTVLNGSPRGAAGNTRLFLDRFLAGLARAPGVSHELAYLAELRERTVHLALYRDAEAVLLAFPMYTAAMPGLVMTFLEELQPFTARAVNPPMAFLIQCGFPEATQLRPLEQYLAKLARRLRAPYLGTVLRGGGEVTRERGDRANRSLYAALEFLGESFGRAGRIDPALARAFSAPERFTPAAARALALAARLGAFDGWARRHLRAAGGFPRRFARPDDGAPPT